MGTELEEAVEAARIYNVRMAVGFLANGSLPENTQPTIRIMAQRVLEEARKRGVDWEQVFDSVVTGKELGVVDRMGGTDHPDPTLHSSPIEAQRRGKSVKLD